MIYSIVRKFLFLLDAEKSHNLSLLFLSKVSPLIPKTKIKSEPTKLFSIEFPNKVGLAAGLDKNAKYLDVLTKFGFGFIEVGTVTPLTQQGNLKPRMFRLKEEKAIINRMGFNNDGVDSLVRNIKKSSYQGVLGINIGKNKDTPNEQALDDYLICLKKTYQYASYIVVNISSPNTKGLRDLQNEKEIKKLIIGLKKEQKKLSEKFGYKAILIKIAPDLEQEEISLLANIFKEYKVDGVVATNTTVDKSMLTNNENASEKGGLSGAPLKEKSTQLIFNLAKELAGEVPIIGVGGILHADDAVEKVELGASLVQIYTGFIYEGPSLIKSIVKKLT